MTDRDRAGRADLTALPLVTIDGETAKDFDDAVYCERKGKGFRLVVAIADVSHYVRDGDPLDRDARERGTSVYFPRRVIPMLPEALSNELCSLKPDVDRLCMVCDMDVTAEGRIAKYEFYPAVMHSRARLTYTQVWNWLETPASAPRAAKALLPRLTDLYALFHALQRAREARGAIDFDSVEMALEFDVKGKIVRIVPVVRNDAHKLIEECMLAANVCTAEFLARHKHPALYRVHEGPTPEKLTALRDFLASCALALPGGDAPTASDYAKLLLQIKERPDYALLQTVLLRSLQQARYRPDNVGHFGLSYEAYAHFTSPIRRYPDLVVHRAIKAVLAGREYKPGGIVLERARRALLAHRAPRRRRDARRRELAQVLFHAGQGRRELRRHDQRRHELRHLRHARRPQHRRPRARDRARTRLFPFRRRTPRDDRRAQRPDLPARRPHPRHRRARRPRNREDRFHARRRSRAHRPSTGSKAIRTGIRTPVGPPRPGRARGADRDRAWTSSSRVRRWPRPTSRPSPTSPAHRASMRSPEGSPPTG